MTLIAFLPFTAHEILFVRRVIEEYLEVYEDEIQRWLQYARGKTTASQCGFHQSMHKEHELNKKKSNELLFSFVFSWSLGIFDLR